MMYQGAHVKPKKHAGLSIRFNKKTYTLLASVILVIAITVGGTLAFMLRNTDSITNTFTVPGGSEPSVDESFNGHEKSNVAIKVQGDVDSYVRARVIINLLDENGNVLGSPSAGDISVSYNETDWYHDTATDTWYYKGIINGSGKTPVLISSASSEKMLSVDIMAQTVQADPAGAVSDAWGMSYSNGSWSTASAG